MVYNFKFNINEQTHQYIQNVLENLKFACTEYYPDGNFEQWLEEKLKE